MKRFHVHVGVEDLERSIRFYSALFGAPPTLRKPDYAKWMVDDPRLNFAISRRGGRAGVNHLGLQVDSPGELRGLRERFSAADSATVLDEPGSNCCYAKSDKHWVTDPQGIAWEGYHTLASIACFDGDAPPERTAASAGCCPTDRAPGPAADACCGPAAAPITLRARPRR
jgi:catechol 2,3-dioxygenase-like lactoylglutathione lyase family enzyme